MKQFIERTTKGKKVTYTRSGSVVTDVTVIERIEAMVIPPAWQEVQIAVNVKAKIQAVGRDAQGRKQYIYSAKHVETQHKAKFDRVLLFAEQLPALRRRVKKDLRRRSYDKEKILACAIRLLDRAHFRVGNERYAKLHSSYGLTTFRRKHVTVDGDTIVFDFIGKSGKQQHKVIKDDSIAGIIAKLDSLPGFEIFRYYDRSKKLVDLKSGDVNDYIKSSIGDGFSAKDFRTWAGTVTAAGYLASLERSDTKKARVKDITASVKAVSVKLGNTPAVARASYIDPTIFELYEKGDAIEQAFSNEKKFKRRANLTKREQCVMQLLGE